MTEDKDKWNDLIDWMEPGKELSDEELASLMQDGDAMSDIKDVLNVKQAVARQGAKEEGLPFDLDKEWDKLSSFIDENTTHSIEKENSETESEKDTEESQEAIIEEKEETPLEKQETIIEEMPKKHFSKPFYVIIGVAASLLLFFVIRQFVFLDSPQETNPQDLACIFQRDSLAGNAAVLTSSDKANAPQVLEGEGIVMPKSEQQPATSTTSRILHALGLDDGDIAMQNNTVTIPPGKSYNITLADGTKVFMYAGSRLTYPVVFSGKERRVYLEGEAYFKVTKDKEHPFVISTEKAEAKVLGTELNVSCYKGEPCHVALLTGSVLVSDKKQTRSVKLVPGQGVTVNESSPLAMSAENMDTYTYWLQGFIYYDDASLAEVTKNIGRWYNVNVVFDNEALKNLKLRYFCQRSESLERAVELLNSYGRFKAFVEGETLHIK